MGRLILGAERRRNLLGADIPSSSRFHPIPVKKLVPRGLEEFPRTKVRLQELSSAHPLPAVAGMALARFTRFRRPSIQCLWNRIRCCRQRSFLLYDGASGPGTNSTPWTKPYLAAT